MPPPSSLPGSSSISPCCATSSLRSMPRSRRPSKPIEHWRTARPGLDQPRRRRSGHGRRAPRRTPELGRIEHKQLSALIGVAPINHDSGQFRGQRHIAGGRASVRCAFDMATLSAVRHNRTLHLFYQRLRGTGTPPRSLLSPLCESSQPFSTPSFAMTDPGNRLSPKTVAERSRRSRRSRRTHVGPGRRTLTRRHGSATLYLLRRSMRGIR